MELREVRRHNLKRLMDKQFGAGARGAQSRLAEMLGKPQNFVSRCLSDPAKPGAKTIGEDFAREIEEVFELPRYSLDNPNLGSAPGPEDDFPLAEVVVRPRYLDQNYEKAAPGLRRIADEIANRILQMPEDRALKLKQAIELLVPADDVKN
ncbi:MULTISPECIES: hypothetical protein [unclassified Pseudomonas]|uniref:hypothetical protein n=1 Tax=unclassified Pseudomonas TaxID=196821 RepID=UPI0021140126|nr:MULTISPECIES: hypothetical protein [unclassified Pseudomonas]